MHTEAFADLLPLVEELKELDTQYRTSLHEATIAQWEKERHIDKQTADALRASPALYQAFLFNDNIPLVGSFLHKLLYSDMYQSHLHRILSDSSYRETWWQATQEADGEKWQRHDRLTQEKAQELLEKPLLYALHKLFFSHGPSFLQKATDNSQLKRMVVDALLPFRMIGNKALQIKWMGDRIEEGIRLQLLTEKQTERLREQTREDKMRSYTVELAAVNAAIEVITLPFYPSVFVYSGDALFTLAVMALPITPGGVLRLSYTVLRGLTEIPESLKKKDGKAFAARLSGGVVAPIRHVGMLFPLPQMAVYYPEMARFFASYSAIKAARKIPVYGASGGAIEHYTYQADRAIVDAASRLSGKIVTIFDRTKHKQEQEENP